MSDNYEDLTAPTENNKLGPDLFGFYAREAAQLLSHDEDLPPFPLQSSHLPENLDDVGIGKGQTKNSSRTKEKNGSASLFSDGLGAQLSEFKKERLKVLLRQSVFSLTQEVDEMVSPVLSVSRIHSCLRYKESILSSNASAFKDDQLESPLKKPKVSSASSETKLSTDVKKCTPCHSIGTLPEHPASDGTKIDDDLRFILENDSTRVEELLKKHSGEIYGTLHLMEQKLEELLNATMTTCRSMTIIEKQHLRKMIQSLPSTNLDRVVGIIAQHKPSYDKSNDEVYVDLDVLDNVTLWRLHFYVKTYLAITKRENDST